MDNRVSTQYGSQGPLRAHHSKADEKAFAVAIAHTQLSLDIQERLYQAFLTPSAIWHALPDALMPYFYQRPSFERFIALRQQLTPQALLEQYDTAGIHVITIFDSQYPERLKVIHQAPPVLFVRGDVSLLRYEAGLSVVGTRKVTLYGHQMTQHLVEGSAIYAPSIVSGLAAGVDTIAHETALANNLPTVAVFGTGMDIIFPKSNLKLAQTILDSGHGALVTELPLGTLPRRFNFPNRNRIIAGLTMGTLVIEAPERSGALITARMALEEGRSVMTIAGNNFSPNTQGCHRLIQQGASLITSAEDIANVMNWARQVKRPPEKPAPSMMPYVETIHSSQETVLDPQKVSTLAPDQKAVFEVISFDPIPRETIELSCESLSVSAIQQALTMLELQGLIRALPGNQFSRIP